MSSADTIVWQSHWAWHPVARAFAISLAIHLFVFSSVEVCNRLNLWRLAPLSFLARSLRLVPARQEPPSLSATTQEPKDLPLVFLDADPSLATPETPPETKYYSAVNVRAGNPDTSRNAEKPKMEGKQDKVPKTTDTVTPVAKPLQPAPPVVEQAAPQVAPVPPKPAVAPKPTERGDLEPVKPPATPPARVRPRTLAAAQAQRGLDSTGTLQGERMRQEGGIKRFSIQATPDSRGTPLGSYDARFIAAVQKCWYALLEAQHFSMDRAGKVVLDFRLNYDGRITDLRLAESTVGELYTALCQLAITKPSPYEKWPPEIRRLVGATYREVRFTFYY